MLQLPARSEDESRSQHPSDQQQLGQLRLRLRRCKAAVDAVGAAGILNVFAAGNGGTGNDGASSFYPATFTSPSVLSVAGSDSERRPRRFQEQDPIYKTNYGATSVDLAAPGDMQS